MFGHVCYCSLTLTLGQEMVPSLPIGPFKQGVELRSQLCTVIDIIEWILCNYN